jgi:hypothetical protein
MTNVDLAARLRSSPRKPGTRVAAISLLLLSAPAIALAQPTAPTAPPTVRPLSVKLTVKVGADTRVHDLAIFDHGCARVEDKTPAYEDDINVCTRAVPQGVIIEVDWRTSGRGGQYRTRSSAVMQKGGSIEVGRATGTRFVLELA